MTTEEYRLPSGYFWNINFPTVAGEKYPDKISLVPHGTEPHAVSFKVLEKTENSELLGYSAVYRDRGRSEQCDVQHLFDQCLTATPVGPSLTSGSFKALHSSVSLVDASYAD